MILDRIQNRAFYRQLSPRVVEALEYLATTDFAKMPDGRHELHGPRMFALVQRYRPKPLAEIVWESHRNFIDVQYMAKGAERMGYVPLGELLPVKLPYNSAHDVILYDAQGDFFTIPEGSFVIFAPQDVHAPGLAVDFPGGMGEVLKVVVKVRE